MPREGRRAAEVAGERGGERCRVASWARPGMCLCQSGAKKKECKEDNFCVSVTLVNNSGLNCDTHCVNVYCVNLGGCWFVRRVVGNG